MPLDHSVILEFFLLQGESHSFCHIYLFHLHYYFKKLMKSWIYNELYILITHASSTERITTSDLSLFISESSILRLIVNKNLLQVQK